MAQEMVNKGQVIQYLADMADIEGREFALRTAVSSLRAESKQRKAEANDALSNAKSKLKSATEIYDNNNRILKEISQNQSKMPSAPVYPKEAYEYCKKNKSNRVMTKPRCHKGFYDLLSDDYFVHCIVTFFMMVFGGALITGVAGTFLLPDYNIELLLIYCYGIIVFFTVVGWYFFLKSNLKDEKTRLNEYQNFIKERRYLEAYESVIRHYEYEKKEYDEKVIRIQADNEKRQKEIEKWASRVEGNKKEVELAEVQVRNSILNSAKVESRSDILEKYALDLEKTAGEICIEKKKIYNIGIVPPSYQTFDCVVMVHSIFYNDLADTMREAILLYEERVFRGEILKGIEKIYTMLGQLAYSMQAIEARLIEIKQSVDAMNYELINISDRLCVMDQRISAEFDRRKEADSAMLHSAWEQNRELSTVREKIKEAINERAVFHQQLLGETKATRYAAESAQFSLRKAEWYMEQRRQGMI